MLLRPRRGAVRYDSPPQSPERTTEIFSVEEYGERTVTRATVARKKQQAALTQLFSRLGNPVNGATETEQCAICTEPKEHVTMLSSCVHTFCADCIGRWFNTTNRCPLCKAVTAALTNVETGETRFFANRDPGADEEENERLSLQAISAADSRDEETESESDGSFQTAEVVEYDSDSFNSVYASDDEETSPKRNDIDDETEESGNRASDMESLYDSD